MANKKLQAGTERPYTWDELRRVIEDICKEQGIVMYDKLDYFTTSIYQDDKDEPIEDIEWNIVSETDFGGSEGIYTDFCVWKNGKRNHVWTAKTLYDGKDDYVKMHEFGARVCLAVMDYVDSHGDEFNWRGYDVGYYDNGERKPYIWTADANRAMAYAKEAMATYGKAYIRDNKTRKYEEF